MTHNSTRWFRMTLSAALITLLPIMASAAFKPTGGNANIAFELNGELVGWLKSAEGGMPFSDVTVSQAAAEDSRARRSGPVKYSDIVVTFGGAMKESLYQWMQDALSGKSQFRSGAIILADQSYTEISRLAFSNAVIVGISFPAIDASAGHTSFAFTLRLSVETARPETAKKGGKISGTFSSPAKIEVSNFRATMSGIDTRFLTKIESVSVTVPVSAGIAGGSRSRTRIDQAPTVSAVVIEGANDTAASLWDWTTDFLINGNNSATKEKTLTIEMLDPSLKKPLLTITLRNLGVFKLEQPVLEANAYTTSVTRMFMYCQGIQFSFPGE